LGYADATILRAKVCGDDRYESKWRTQVSLYYAAILLAHYCDRLRKHWARHEGQRLTLFMHGVSHDDIPEIE
jgi:hypothetical protein